MKSSSSILLKEQTGGQNILNNYCNEACKNSVEKMHMREQFYLNAIKELQKDKLILQGYKAQLQKD
jgi:hypothetical protein